MEEYNEIIKVKENKNENKNPVFFSLNLFDPNSELKLEEKIKKEENLNDNLNSSIMKKNKKIGEDKKRVEFNEKLEVKYIEKNEEEEYVNQEAPKKLSLFKQRLLAKKN